MFVFVETPFYFFFLSHVYPFSSSNRCVAGAHRVRVWSRRVRVRQQACARPALRCPRSPGGSATRWSRHCPAQWSPTCCRSLLPYAELYWYQASGLIWTTLLISTSHLTKGHPRTPLACLCYFGAADFPQSLPHCIPLWSSKKRPVSLLVPSISLLLIPSFELYFANSASMPQQTHQQAKRNRALSNIWLDWPLY